MKSVFFLVLVVYLIDWTVCQAFAKVDGEEDQKYSAAKFVSEIPDKDKLMVAQKFHNLCMMKPTFGAAEWTQNIKSSILRQLSTGQDSRNSLLLQAYLVDNLVNIAVTRCTKSHNRKAAKQEYEDIFDGVGSILQNVFSGNLFGIIQSSVGIRAPERVGTMVSDIMQTLLGNIAKVQDAISTSGVGQGQQNNGAASGTLGTSGNKGTGTAAGTLQGTGTGATNQGSTTTG